MAGDAAAGIVVTGPGGEERRDAFSGLRVVSLAEGTWRSASDAALDVEIDEHQLAYVLYTSGSTGVPKGVGVSHYNVTRLFAVTKDWCGFGAADVSTLFHSHGFDISVWELWGALLFGGRLVVVPYWVRRSPEQFHALLRDARVTVLNQTPSGFRQLRTYGGDWRDLTVRIVICGGEELRYEELTDWAEGSAAGVRLVNMYGITETTVHVTRCEVGPAELSGSRGSVIGGPLADLQMFVLDERLEPVPQGVPGELYVGGGGVARGYAGRPALTASRFVPDPYGGEAGARLYRSGDVVRYLGAGEYAYVGRADRQVKIRGHRIELGEVETALLAAGVREAVVEHRVGPGGMDRLVAYVVGEARDVEALRTVLAERLPVYMLPSAYVWLERLPLTAHGKVDHAALPEPTSERPTMAEGYAEPGSEVERALASIWQEVLGISRVGVHDSFFSLGGDSIRSLQVQALAEKRSLRFTLEQLFRHPTIQGLATAIAAARVTPELPRTKPFDLVDDDERGFPPDIEDAYPLTQLQAGMLYHIILAPQSNIYHNTGGRHIRTELPFDAEAFQAAVRSLVANHAVFRTSFDFHSYREPLQLVHRDATLPLEIVDLRHLSLAEQEAVLAGLLESERARPFDLTQPTLLRFFVHLRSDETIQFTITECHAIYDGWSYHSAIVELFNTYAALATGQPLPRRDPLAVTFRDFVALERRVIASEPERAYWKRTLQNCVVSTLPRLRTAARVRSQPEIRSLDVTVPERVSLEIQKLARLHGMPLKSMLLAAHLKAIGMVCGARDVLTGVVTNGRPDTVDSDRLFGLFLNSVPFRLALPRGSWFDLVAATHAQESELLAHRRLPLTVIQDVCDRQGLCDETLFNYMDFHVYDGLEPGLGFEVLGGNNSEGSNITLTAHFQRRTLMSLLEKTRLFLQLAYDSTQLTEAQVAEIGRLYVGVLSEMAERFTEPHDGRALLPVVESVRLQASGAGAGERASEAFLTRFRASAARTPHAVAVAHGTERLTYAELDEKSNRLAHCLRDRGVLPEGRVGVCLEPCVDLLVSLLAIWKAGAAYIPLDPNHPPERLAYMHKHAAADVVLTSDLLQAANGFAEAGALCLDRHPHALMHYPSSPVEDSTLPDNLAYVIYTSGSTGQPKGCGVPREAFGNLVDWSCRSLSADGPVRALILSSFGFNLTQKNLFAPLAVGGSVHLSSSPYFDTRAICRADRTGKNHAGELHAQRLLPAAGCRRRG